MDRDIEFNNYLRLAKTIKGYGGEAVRQHFESVFPSEKLKHVLYEHQSFLFQQMKERKFKRTTFEKIFSHKGYPDIADFDIQMMIDVLVNMKHKYSIKENDINIISYYRNFLEHQCDLTKISDDFENIWTEVSNAIESLGGSILKNECDILKITPTNVLSELGDAEKELVNTNNDHQRLQNNFETITKQAKASYSESHTIIYYRNGSLYMFDDLSPEETRLFIRLCKLVSGVAPWAVRSKFDKIFPPEMFPENVPQYIKDELYRDEIKRLKWTKIEEKESATSADLDFQLLTSILASVDAEGNICMCSGNNNQCEHEALQTLQHYKDIIKEGGYKRMSTETLNQHYSSISQAVISLGGTEYREICEHVLSDEINNIDEGILLRITKLQDKLETQKIQHENIKSNIRKSIAKMSNPIPEHLLYDIKLVTEKWKDDNKNQVTLGTITTLLEYLQEKSCVVVIGGLGAGKTSIIRSVALQMHRKGYLIIPVKSPNDIYRLHSKGSETLFVFDDFCGKYIINEKQISSWKSCTEKIEMVIKDSNCKILMSSKSYLFMDKRVATLSLFQCKSIFVYDLMKFSILDQECQQMAKNVKLDPITLCENTDLHIIFPSLIQNLKESKINTISSHDISTSVYEIYKTELDIFFAKDKLKYCALALLVMFNNHLVESCLTNDIDEEIEIKIEETYKACKANLVIPKQSLLSELEVMIDSFTVSFYDSFVKVFSAKNETVFNILAKHIGTKIQSCLISFGDASFLSQRAAFRCAVTEKSSSPLTLFIDDEHKDFYLKRMIMDLNDGYVSDVFLNINLESPAFRDIYFEIIKRQSRTEQIKNMNKIDFFNKTTPLLQSCFFGDIHVIDWILSLGVDVNLCRDDGTSPLFVACQEGHKDIACRLLEYGANVNLCTNGGVTPLDIANEQGHNEISSVLVAFKTDKILLILFILFHTIFLLYISAV